MPMISEATPIAFADPLPEAVDVVVIGAGVVGTATAYFLSERGVKVALCEKGRVAGEQSSRNWGWVRQQGRDYAELPIMMESNRIWRGLAEKTGQKDLTFTPSGCVYLAESADEMARLESWYDVARQHQLDTRMLTPSDGRAEPFVAVPALAQATRALGAAVIENCAVRTVETAAGRVAAVATELGRVRTERVVLAGGAWSTYFTGNLGLDLPQLVVRSTVGRTNPSADREMPNINSPGFDIRRRADGGYTVATGDLAEHYVAPRSFKYFTKYLKLMKISARDLRLRLGPPSDYPGAWGAKSRWTGDEITPFEQMRVLNPPPSEIVRRRLNERLPQRAPWLKDVGFAEVWAGHD